MPVPGPGECLLRVTAVGLCGSDRHWYLEGAIGDADLADPLVLGHEFAALVEGGPRDGQRVVVDPAAPCGRCALCRSGRSRLCATLRFAGHPPTDGALRTWMTWPATRCVRLPDAIPDHDAVLLEPLGVALHAIDLAELPPNAAAGVYGCGPIGQLLVRALRTRGVRTIVATDRHAHRVDAAVRSGATKALLVDGTSDPAATLPVDVAFECAGDDAALETAIRACRPGGRLLVLGIPDGGWSRFPAAPARRKELRLQLVRRMEAQDLPRAVRMVADGALRLDDLVTHAFGLDEVGTAFEALAARSGIKVIVSMDQPAARES